MNHQTKKEAILNVQRYLRQLSYFDSAIPGVPIDGIYDSMTREAVRAFQQQAGLPVTGIVDHATFDALYAAYEASLKQNDFTIQMRLTLPDLSDIEPDAQESLFEIAWVQYLLNELCLRYDDLGQHTVNGKYSSENAEGVRAFQRHHHLPDTGRVDRETLRRMIVEHNRLTP